MRTRMRHRYRRFSWLSDLGGIQATLLPSRAPQPRLKAVAAHERPPIDGPWLERRIAEIVATHADNAFEYPFGGEKIYDQPLVGFARGDDPLFERLKTVIGPAHLTPSEVMAWQARLNAIAPPPAAEIGVLAYVLPFTAATTADNAAATEWPSERWAQTRLLGELFNQTLMRMLVSELMGLGILAVAPDATPFFRKRRYPGVGWASPWSHRHIAYAAGLGSFGKHDFFITEKGSAHRLGSLVVHLPLEPGRERPEDIHAHCLACQGHTCMRCAARCPAGAITAEHGHDKEACARRVSRSLAYCNNHYHIFIYGCGLCATGVPCATGIPKQLRDKD